jgi:hypothetical protein
LHNLRNGGSLTSSIGAGSKGKSGSSMLPIFYQNFLQNYTNVYMIKTFSFQLSIPVAFRNVLYVQLSIFAFFDVGMVKIFPPQF